MRFPLNQDNAQARNNYGTYLYQLQRYNDAIEQFTRAGATLGYEQRYQSLENLGRIYLKLGDVANAENHSNRRYRQIEMPPSPC